MICAESSLAQPHSQAPAFYMLILYIANDQFSRILSAYPGHRGRKVYTRGMGNKISFFLLGITYTPFFYLPTNLPVQGWFGSRLVANGGTSLYFHLLDTLLTAVKRGRNGRRRRKTRTFFPPHRSEPERNRKDTKYVAI